MVVITGQLAPGQKEIVRDEEAQLKADHAVCACARTRSVFVLVVCALPSPVLAGLQANMASCNELSDLNEQASNNAVVSCARN